MQLFMYMCEECRIARFFEKDYGNVYYAQCGGCCSLVFHHAVLIDSVYHTQPNQGIQNESKLRFYDSTKEKRKVN